MLMNTFDPMLTECGPARGGRHRRAILGMADITELQPLAVARDGELVMIFVRRPVQAQMTDGRSAVRLNSMWHWQMSIRALISSRKLRYGLPNVHLQRSIRGGMKFHTGAVGHLRCSANFTIIATSQPLRTLAQRYTPIYAGSILERPFIHLSRNRSSDEQNRTALLWKLLAASRFGVSPTQLQLLRAERRSLRIVDATLLTRHMPCYTMPGPGFARILPSAPGVNIVFTANGMHTP
ncbi:hypothetical protein A0H81_10427 [Grifola frondosa]|uniref:Uncharacterized protein n=1 Tax=Grifola frondosa TaxID=5627 RepID=A0A1C7M0A5_GRIFR|nr:hypothetical protein A0H81_10427 [Grifola frondosa]